MVEFRNNSLSPVDCAQYDHLYRSLSKLVQLCVYVQENGFNFRKILFISDALEESRKELIRSSNDAS